MDTPIFFKRETSNYYVYETSADSGDEEVKVLYLPKSIFRSITAEPKLNVILSSRKVHVCNCEYCTRAER